MVNGHGHFGELKPAVKIDFTALRHDTETETKREKVIAAEAREDARDSADQQTYEWYRQCQRLARSACRSIRRTSVTASRSAQTATSFRWYGSTPNTRTARERGIEGWVQVQFTITPAGTVADQKVVDADPKGLFERAALDAIGRWKYNPKVVDGRAMERRGVMVVLTFKLEK